MTHAPPTSRLSTWLLSGLWGPYSKTALWVALTTLVIDQAHKWWMLLSFEIREKGRVAAAPFLDLVYKLNTGISFSLFDSSTYTWQLVLCGFSVLASLALWGWLAAAGTSRLMAASLGLIIGGALGNGIDRAVLGGVLDYLQPHAFGWYWPTVFNIADVAIVAGVAGLLYDSLVTSRNDAANPL